MKKKPRPKKEPNPYIIFAVNTFQMGLTVFIFVQIGIQLDAYFEFEKTLRIIFALIGFLVGFILCYKTIQRINK
tara:strand:- start:1643 stop:1864 length:222 start_codon:yes stop_codon:yes gene_type:complete